MADFSHVPARYRFVGGRRHYNRLRREAAEARRRQLVDLVCKDSDVTQRALAEALGVHECTISRDLAILSPVAYWRFYLPWANVLSRGTIKAALRARWRAEPAAEVPAPVVAAPVAKVKAAPVPESAGDYMVHVEAVAPIDPAAAPAPPAVVATPAPVAAIEQPPAPVAVAPRPVAATPAPVPNGLERARRELEARLLADALAEYG